MNSCICRDVLGHNIGTTRGLGFSEQCLVPFDQPGRSDLACCACHLSNRIECLSSQSMIAHDSCPCLVIRRSKSSASCPVLSVYISNSLPHSLSVSLYIHDARFLSWSRPSLPYSIPPLGRIHRPRPWVQTRPNVGKEIIHVSYNDT